MRRVVAAAGALTTLAIALGGCNSNGGAEPTTEPTQVGGQAVCDEPTIRAAVEADFEANYPGSTFVALEDFRCEGGWAMANAEFEASGSTFPTVVFLRAEGQFWIPTTIEEICATPQAESDVPSDMYVAACGVE
ncbi:MAG: hypothetical protein RL347_933 [Actinomycetota bacterium]|jgi:hypothetical protein